MKQLFFIILLLMLACDAFAGFPLHITHFRFGSNDGTESTHGWIANEDISISPNCDSDYTFILRAMEQETLATAASNIDATFEYNKNGAGWVAITTVSTVIKAIAVTPLTNGGNCTKRLTGTGTFETSGAGQTTDGTSGGTANDIVASGCSETALGAQIVAADVANNDIIQFRITSPDGAVTMDLTPQITVVKSPPPAGIPNALMMQGAGM